MSVRLAKLSQEHTVFRLDWLYVKNNHIYIAHRKRIR
jgi:hypothetical protein